MDQTANLVKGALICPAKSKEYSKLFINKILRFKRQGGGQALLIVSASHCNRGQTSSK